MRIRRVSIEAFGHFRDLDLPFGPGLNLITGGNEAGKSTLLAFVRAMLFGFERRASPARYEPELGRFGGSMVVEGRGQVLQVVRRAGRRAEGDLRLLAGEAPVDRDALDELLGGVSRDLFNEVFAFGLQELMSFQRLAAEGTVSQALSAAGIQGASRLPEAEAALRRGASAIFAPRATKLPLNTTLAELASVRARLKAMEGRTEEHARLKTEVEAAHAALTEAERVERQARVAHLELERLLKAGAATERLEAADAELRALGEVRELPEGVLERAQELDAASERLTAELARRDAELAQLAEELRSTELRSRHGEELKRARAALAAHDEHGALAKSLSPRRLDLERRRGEHARRWANLSRSWMAAGAAALTLILIGGLLFWTGSSWTGVALGAVSLTALAVWAAARARARREAGAAIQGELDALEADEESLAAVRGALLETARAVGVATGDPAPEDGWERGVRALGDFLEEQLRLAERARELGQRIALLGAERALRAADREELSLAKDALLRSVGADDVSALRNLAAKATRQRQLLAARGDAVRAIEVEAGTRLGEVREALATHGGMEGARRALAECGDVLRARERERRELGLVAGRVVERLAAMERSDERFQLRAREEELIAEATRLAEQAASSLAGLAVLRHVRERFEREQQPELLRSTSRLFEDLTSGRYRRVYRPLEGEPDLCIADERGREWPAARLSRGTRDLLYLAFRLAIVTDFGRTREVMPIVLDDVLVNLDPQRTRAVVKTLVRLSDAHQVIAFSCHPSIEEIFRAEGAHVSTLGTGTLALISAQRG